MLNQELCISCAELIIVDDHIDFIRLQSNGGGFVHKNKECIKVVYERMHLDMNLLLQSTMDLAKVEPCRGLSSFGR